MMLMEVVVVVVVVEVTMMMMMLFLACLEKNFNRNIDHFTNCLFWAFFILFFKLCFSYFDDDEVEMMMMMIVRWRWGR